MYRVRNPNSQNAPRTFSALRGHSVHRIGSSRRGRTHTASNVAAESEKTRRRGWNWEYSQTSIIRHFKKELCAELEIQGPTQTTDFPTLLNEYPIWLRLMRFNISARGDYRKIHQPEAHSRTLGIAGTISSTTYTESLAREAFVAGASRVWVDGIISIEKFRCGYGGESARIYHRTQFLHIWRVVASLSASTGVYG